MPIATLIMLDEHHQFTKYLGQIATIDFVDNKEKRARVFLRALTKIIKNTVTDRKAVFGWTYSLNKVLVSIRLVELDGLNTSVILFSKY